MSYRFIHSEKSDCSCFVFSYSFTTFQIPHFHPTERMECVQIHCVILYIFAICLIILPGPVRPHLCLKRYEKESMKVLSFVVNPALAPFSD